MHIVADENIPFAREAFGALGDVVTMAGREMSPASVKDADILLVRSVTTVGAQLLDGSRVRFVATATIGTDHIDQEYLRDRGITFAAAPGSNANSVAEYVVTALLTICRERGERLEGKRIAVVGVGNVGSTVARYAAALGMKVLRNDPPLFLQTGDPMYRPLDEVIDADIVTFHVPLTRDGEHPTFHLANRELFAAMNPNAIFLNTSRGAVTDTAALIGTLEAGRMSAAIDVWEDEPDISMELLERTSIATPHIAGYSFDGKVNATAAIYRAACACIDAEPVWDAAGEMPEPAVPAIEIDCTNISEEDALREAALAVYDIQRDDTNLRQIRELPNGDRPPYFDRLRREYPKRREFFNTRLTLKNGSDRVKKKLETLGFHIKEKNH